MSNSLTPVRVPLDKARDKQLLSSREEGSNVHPERGRRTREQMSVKGSNPHVSVMLKEVLEYLEPKKGETVVDATFGAGGHSKAFAAAAKINLISIDADPHVVSAHSGVVEGNFSDLDSILKKAGIAKIDKAVFDLGWNKGQLADGRGFSFLTDEPLNMSYGTKPASGFTAAEIVNTWSEKVLADVFFGYGEERYARRIAKAIAARREIKKIETTIELVEIIRDAVPAAYRRGRINPATKSFQALRIAVNDELKTIEKGIASAWKHLNCGGRIGVISFHSTEDRVVKRAFADLAKKSDSTQVGKLVVKKPVIPSKTELGRNPSSRSAKLRVIEKICND